MVENKDYFIGKWEEQINGQDILERVIAKRFIATFKTAKPIDRFDVDIYFKLIEKITVYDGKLVVSLLDRSDVETLKSLVFMRTDLGEFTVNIALTEIGFDSIFYR